MFRPSVNVTREPPEGIDASLRRSNRAPPHDPGSRASAGTDAGLSTAAAAAPGRAVDPGGGHAVQPELHLLLRLIGPRHRPASAHVPGRGTLPRARGAAARGERVLLH